MLKYLLSVLLLLSFYLAPAIAGVAIDATSDDTAGEIATATSIFDACGLVGEMDEQVFTAGYSSVEAYGQDATILAIADMSQPSIAKRLYIIDLKAQKLLMRTYVAHGQKTGQLMATQFSDKNDSHQTSLGLYRVGTQITSPKHGAALLLYGLDKGVNCKAVEREVIMHGADYVSDEFIKANGRLGRSWGCPAMSRADMPAMISFLANGGLLYIHG